MTVAEFLAWDDGTDRRYELVDGVVRMMAAPSSAHSTIVGNLAVALGRRLRDPCRVRIEYGLRLDWSDYDCYQIDLAVVCGDVRRGETLPEPVLIVEVSARDALQHDRGRKTPDYRLLPGCRCILIVESERRRVERWARDGARWIVQDHIGETGAVPADRLDVAVDLAEIYAGVEI
jgi:Uma2 family endonuclease